MLERISVVALATAAVVFATLGAAEAGERTGTRSYSRGSASSEQSVEVFHGQRRGTTTWTNPTGRKGDVYVKTTWDPASRKDVEDEEAAEEGEEGAAAEESGDAAADATTEAAAQPEAAAAKSAKK